jgi:hypothetical protein
MWRELHPASMLLVIISESYDTGLKMSYSHLRERLVCEHLESRRNAWSYAFEIWSDGCRVLSVDGWHKGHFRHCKTE